MSEVIIDALKALDFAARRHCEQKRKGEAAEPYVNHLIEVALLLSKATGGQDRTLILAGILHDTLEDTETTRGELRECFGAEVSRLVAEVTDDKSLPKHERKRLQIATAQQKSRRAKMLKLADKTSNLRSILSSPPLGWDRRRKVEYFVWARDVVSSCRGVNSELEDAFDTVFQVGLAALNEP